MPAFAITNDLSWTVSHRPIFFTGKNGEQLPVTERVAVVRDDNDAYLGSVSPNYETVQNEDLLRLINPMVEEGLLTIENMGYLNNGARVFAQAIVNKEFQVIGEDYKGYITLLNGHVGNASVAIGTSSVRVICGNTFSMAYQGLGEKYRHSEGVNERFLSSDTVVNFVNGAMKKYSEYVEKLATTNCTHAQFRKAVEEIYQKEVKDMRASFVDQLNNLFYNGRGNEGRTMYDAFNAITEYGSNYSRKSDSGRFNYVNFGAGAQVNRRALAVLNELAAV